MDNEQKSNKETIERPGKDDSDSKVEPLYLNLELDLTHKEVSSFLTSDKNQPTTDEKTDIELSFIRAGLATDNAKLAISNLPDSDKDRWRQYQIELADVINTKEYKDYKECLDKRNAEFPEIAQQLAKAAEHIDSGEASLRSYNTNLEVAAMQRQAEARYLPPLTLFGKEDTPRSILKSNSSPFDSSWQNGNTALDLRDSATAKLFALPARDQPQVEQYNSLFSRGAKADLAAIDQPGHREIAKMRGEHVVGTLKRILSPYAPAEVREEFAKNLDADIEKIMQNPRSSFESKDQFFRQVERLISGDRTTTFATSLDRRIIAAQLLSQAANVTAIDQGNFGTCALSSIEKRLLERHPDILSKMIADVAISGTTTSASDRKIVLEREWLNCDYSTATDYPPRDGVRSLASQYSALILGNLKFQLQNERKGKDWRYGHVNGKDVLLDYKQNPPEQLYQNRLTNRLEHGKYYKTADGRVIIDESLEPLKKEAVDSPLMTTKSVLETYEAATGSKSERIAMIHYNEARIPGDYSLKGWSDWWMQTEQLKDPRLLVFRHESDLKKVLKDSERTSNFPLIFISPEHAASVSNYDKKSNRAEYDNQWGKQQDYVGQKALDPQHLLKLATRESSDRPARTSNSNDKQLIDRIKSLRSEYEDWCTTNGIAPDSRYPSKLELEEWRSRKNKSRP